MITARRGACPRSLDGAASVGGRERAAAIAFYADAVNRGRAFKAFKTYKGDDVKLSLEAMFGDKCAYCESRLAHVGPFDIEHYRPKGAVTLADGTTLKPGYYWLAATWENLLPSCPDCNRARKHAYVGGVRRTGKANAFPLVDESQRAMAPGEEVRERPLLLHPCDDDPDEHLEFLDEGVIAPAAADGVASDRGRATIEVLGLQRPALVRARNDHRIVVDRAIDHFRRAAGALDEAPDDEALAEDLRLEAAELKRLMDPGTHYAAMARQRIHAALGAVLR